MESLQLEAPTFTYETKMEGATQLATFAAVPITPGVHKGFLFTPELIKSIDFKGTNLVENHKITGKPSDSKGTVLDQGVEGFNIQVKGVVTNPDTAKKVLDGQFHSVSSHFSLEADENKVVTKILEVVELTLTENPADPAAVITETGQMTIQLEGEKPPVAEAIPGGTNMAEEEKPKEKPTSVTLEAEVKQLRLEMQALQDRNDMLERAQKVKDATTYALQLTTGDKPRISPAQMDSVTQLWVTLSDEQKKIFKVFLDNNSPIPPEMRESAGEVEQDDSKPEVPEFLLKMDSSQWELFKQLGTISDNNTNVTVNGGKL